jgi:hypothetical protein
MRVKAQKFAMSVGRRKKEGILMLATFCLLATKFGQGPFISTQARCSSETERPHCLYRVGNRSNMLVEKTSPT